MGKAGPFLGWQKTAEVSLYSRRILVPGKPEPLGKSFAMSIDNNPGSTKGMAKNDVRGLPPDTRKSRQGVHRRRDLAAEFFDELACAFLQRPGLGAEKS